MQNLAISFEELAKMGRVKRTRKNGYFSIGKLEDYRRGESIQNAISHVNDSADGTSKVVWLQTFGLEDWIIMIENQTFAAIKDKLFLP